RLGEPRVPPEERETLVAAVGALAAVSVPLVLDAFLAATVELRPPYRAAIRKAADRALEPLQGRLADEQAPIAAAAAELVGLTGSPQAVALLLPLVHHQSELVREAALLGLAEAGGGDRGVAAHRAAGSARPAGTVQQRQGAGCAQGGGGGVAMTTRAAKTPTGDAVLSQSITRVVAKRVVGQEVMVERLLVGLLTGGHVLLEGVPGLAKTLAVRTAAGCLRIAFSRIQFTPDLLPADVIGTMVFDQKSQEFY